MSRRNPLAKWVLPDVVDPPDTICYTIEVPNNIYHRAAFWGALLDLGAAYKWADDPAHTAVQVANVWRRQIDKIVRCPAPQPVKPGIWEDFALPIRVDCDCRVWVTCCDGTEVELATVGMLEQPGQPGTGTPQPPVGGTECYQADMQANSTWLVPTVVNTGDVLTLSNASGAGNDGSQLFWRCPTGETFFAGSCSSGTGFPVAGDPSGVDHMRLLYVIAGVYYDAMAGPFTVPAGIVDEQVTVQVNDSALADNSGSYKFQVCRQNNSAATWAYTLNLRTSPQGFVAFDGGQWVPGTGLQSTEVPGSPNYGQQLAMTTDFGQAVNFTRVKFTFDTVLGSHGGTRYQQFGLRDSGGSYTQLDIQNTPVTGTGQSLEYNSPFTAYGLSLIGVVDVVANPGPTDGSWTNYLMEVEGSGYDPFA